MRKIEAITLILLAFALTFQVNHTLTAQSTVELTTRITEGAFVNQGRMSRGVAWGDYDNDGYPDLFVANSEGQANFLYHNNGDGTFTPTADGEIVLIESNSESGHWVDYDNDGDLDLFVTNRNSQENFLFQNNGDGDFTRITEGDIVTERRSSTGSCWADYDNDGDVDVFVANRDRQVNSLFDNNGDGTFTQVTEGKLVTLRSDSRVCGWADVDGDNDLDLYVGNAHAQNFFYLNNGDATFKRVSNVPITNQSRYTYGFSWADVDNDGDVDLFVANMMEPNELYLNDGQGNFTELTDSIIVTDGGGPSKGNTWGDFDNDGDVDLYVANGTPDADVKNYLYLNDGQGGFTSVTTDASVLVEGEISSGTAGADYDNDGDLDIFVANWANNDQNNAFYRNDGAAGNWVAIQLVGTQSNAFGVGATLWLEATINGQTVRQMRQAIGNTGYGSQNSHLIHFGLGDASEIESLDIRWPSGIVDTYEALSVNALFVATENEGITAGND